MEIITRRKFLKQGAMAATAAFIGTAVMPHYIFAHTPYDNYDISVVKGEKYFENTIKAVQTLGGIEKFVKKGAKVGLLINSDFDKPGTFVNPDIAIAIVKMCNNAEAAQITCLQKVKDEYWTRSSHFEANKNLISKLKHVESNTFPAKFNEDDFVKLNIEKGKKTEKRSRCKRTFQLRCAN